ncbi:MotE family protein [Gluconobacter frateurii]|uniref:Magnesium transporter MgtE intracellular domain-containing protein n=1 Tax=Gluconobacter frateurii NRIC 0228 TaxID=1307946 RepID=A0ABQ0QAY5_9PROT|nr:hypothetical protein [Gluconobacter frateurii]GBR11450.1 hypothetical protein AA0228_1380 [Gluconobacter frateurii NRIC 0228]GLP89111.1 hypothetical protein GCM10007868_01860 [Gluconobacter frateurii]
MFFRLLHISCGLMIVLLGIKVYDLVEYVGAEPSTGSSLVASAVAQPSAAPVSAETSTQKADTSPSVEKKPAAVAAPVPATADLCKAGGCQGTPQAPQSVAAETVDPALKAELNARQQELDRKAEALDERQRLVDAGEEELQRRMTALQASRSQIEDSERHSDELLNQDTDRLVKIYEAMKPADAAVIFNILDLRVGVGLLNRMSSRKASAIMEAMSPQRAILATQLLANIHAHAGPRGING